MAYTKIYKCSECGEKMSLSGRSSNERMLREKNLEAFLEMHCLDCKKTTKTKGKKVCGHCAGSNVTDDDVIPCKFCNQGKLVHEEGNIVMF